MKEQEVAARWSGQVATVDCDGNLTVAEASSRRVGVPSNNAIAKSLMSQIQTAGGKMLFGRHAVSAQYESGVGWHLTTKHRFAGPEQPEEEKMLFDGLVLSDKLLVLPNQYAVLSPEDTIGLQLPNTLQSTQTIVLLLAVTQATAPMVSEFLFEGHQVLHRAFCDSLKPGRNHDEGTAMWVVHSTQSFALDNLDGEQIREVDSALARIRDSFMAIGYPEDAVSATVLHSSVFAWDHAQPVSSSCLSEPYRCDRERKAGVCGDFFHADARYEGVEAAALSGLALAEEMAPLFELSPQIQSEL